MQTLLDSIVAWIKSRNITSHAVAGMITAMAVAYITDAQVRDYVSALFKEHPKILAAIGGACALWLKYSSAHSALGVLEEVPAARAKLAKQEVKTSS